MPIPEPPIPDSHMADGRLPLGLMKGRDMPMCDIEEWIDDPKRKSLPVYYGKEKLRVDALMESAHEEITHLRLRLLRLTRGGTPVEPVTNQYDTVRILTRHAMHLRGKAEAVPEMVLIDGLDRAVSELHRHRSLL